MKFFSFFNKSVFVFLILSFFSVVHACDQAIYHFAFKDWKKLGTGWVAREVDYRNDPKGVSIFVDLSAEEFTEMNQGRANTLEVPSVLLRVACSNIPKGLVITSDPTSISGRTKPGGSKHAVINSKKRIFSAEDFNEEFKNPLIDASSVWQTIAPNQ